MAELEAYKAEPNKMTHSLNKCLQGKKKTTCPVEYYRYNREENHSCP